MVIEMKLVEKDCLGLYCIINNKNKYGFSN